MHPAVRLTRRPDGGFRIEGAVATPIDGVSDDAGFVVAGAGSWRLVWNAEEHGWNLTAHENGLERDAGRTATRGVDEGLAPVSVLLPDGRLFRLAMFGASEPRFELGRWDVPGAYLVGRMTAGAWTLERTAAGAALEIPTELWILTCVEIGRLDAWF